MDRARSARAVTAAGALVGPDTAVRPTSAADRGTGEGDGPVRGQEQDHLRGLARCGEPTRAGAGQTARRPPRQNATGLSAGERQRHTVVLVFLARPWILILDEAASSVDTRTDVLVQGTDRTGFDIAHRLFTMRDPDALLVMEAGRSARQAHWGDSRRDPAEAALGLLMPSRAREPRADFHTGPDCRECSWPVLSRVGRLGSGRASCPPGVGPCSRVADGALVVEGFVGVARRARDVLRLDGRSASEPFEQTSGHRFRGAGGERAEKDEDRTQEVARGPREGSTPAVTASPAMTMENSPRATRVPPTRQRPLGPIPARWVARGVGVRAGEDEEHRGEQVPQPGEQAVGDLAGQRIDDVMPRF